MTSIMLMLFGALTVIIVVAAFTWPRLSTGGKQCVTMYVVSYAFTYGIGGVWIGVTDGAILGSYFRDRLYIPSILAFGSTYWIVLLAPVIVPMVIVAIFNSPGRRLAPRTSGLCGRAPFVALFAALAGYAVFRIFHTGYGVVNALTNMKTLYGDTASILEQRLQLFEPGTSAAFGVIYSALPALCHVALFHARWTRGWRGIALGASVVTLVLLLATFQIAPAAVFAAAIVISASSLGLVRVSARIAFSYGVAFLFVLQGLNGWKFGDWTFLENIRHLVFRMPAALPYYLSCFPTTVPFLGTDWFGSVTGGGADPGSPFIVARYMYRDALGGSAMAAPAQVQAYAEGGLLNALLAVVAIGAVLVGIALLYRKSGQSAIWHGLYIQGLVAIYYSTQTSFRGIIWHSYGYFWTLGTLLLLAALSWRPATASAPRAGGAFRPMRRFARI